jgi:hypothetical protein
MHLHRVLVRDGLWLIEWDHLGNEGVARSVEVDSVVRLTDGGLWLRLRKVNRDQRGVHLRYDEPPDGEEAGPFVRLLVRSLYDVR